MKKIITVLAAAIVAASALSAADVALGVRGKGSLNAGTKFVEKNEPSPVGTYEYPKVFGGGLMRTQTLPFLNLVE